MTNNSSHRSSLKVSVLMPLLLLVAAFPLYFQSAFAARDEHLYNPDLAERPYLEPSNSYQDLSLHELATGAFTVEQDYPATKVQETLRMTLEEDGGDITGSSLNPKRERYKVTGVVWKARNGRYKMQLKRPSPGNMQSYDLTYDVKLKVWEGEVHNTWNNVTGHAIITKNNN